MQPEIDNILNILKSINNEYNLDLDNNKEKIIIDDWLILNNNIYNQYKNKITINSIRYIPQKDDIANGLKLIFETKKLYGFIKYNAHYITFVISETEYGLIINQPYLIGINIRVLQNHNKKKTTLPKFKSILKVLGWKITKNALQSLKDNVSSLEE
jgi:hypothetical protein